MVLSFETLKALGNVLAEIMSLVYTEGRMHSMESPTNISWTPIDEVMKTMMMMLSKKQQIGKPNMNNWKISCCGLTLAKSQTPMKVSCPPSPATDGQREKNLRRLQELR